MRATEKRFEAVCIDAGYCNVYDEEKDCYYCPMGNRLAYGGKNNAKKAAYYENESKTLCEQCPPYSQCTKSKTGRRITRYLNENLRNRLKRQYDQFQDLYAQRKQRAELPFGHIKRNLEYGSFLLREIKKIRVR